MTHVELTARALDPRSHLFDGVDGRQLINALKVGAETAKEDGGLFGFRF